VKAWAFLGVLLTTVGTAHAAETGNSLLQYANKSNLFEQGYYQGYVVGVIEGNVLKVCIPDRVTLGQLAQVVKKYMEGHPERLHRWADEIVLEAVAAAWPCRK
jgi:hypothetical protein